MAPGTGRSRATFYRRLGPPAPPKPRAPRPSPPQKLTDRERQAVLDVLHQERYADLSVAQVWTRELDEGRYHASQSTMYRILREQSSPGRFHKASTPSGLQTLCVQRTQV